MAGSGSGAPCLIARQPTLHRLVALPLRVKNLSQLTLPLQSWWNLSRRLFAFSTPSSAPFGPGAALSMRQKALTHLVDDESRRASSTAFRALLRSEAEPGARAFLAARRGGPTRMDSAFFVAELRHRLQIPEATSDKWWPLCNASSTLFHCMLARVARREKTLRHTAVRDALFRWADRPNLQPEKERPGLLLPQRPDDLANQLPTSSFPASPVSPLLLTWPSRPPSGKTSLDLLLQLLL